MGHDSQNGVCNAAVPNAYGALCSHTFYSSNACRGHQLLVGLRSHGLRCLKRRKLDLSLKPPTVSTIDTHHLVAVARHEFVSTARLSGLISICGHRLTEPIDRPRLPAMEPAYSP